MKNLSLQDQLLKAGLSNEHKAKQLRTEKRKQSKQQRKNKVEVVDETKKIVEEKKAQQLEKDRLLNQQRNAEAETKQIANQIVQLIELNKLPKDEDGIAYNFNDKNIVKVIYISEEIRNKVVAGQLAIVKSKSAYEVVNPAVAEKIKQRDEGVIVVQFDNTTDEPEDDGYQGYEIPDDLMW